MTSRDKTGRFTTTATDLVPLSPWMDDLAAISLVARAQDAAAEPAFGLNLGDWHEDALAATGSLHGDARAWHHERASDYDTREHAIRGTWNLTPPRRLGDMPTDEELDRLCLIVFGPSDEDQALD